MIRDAAAILTLRLFGLGAILLGLSLLVTGCGKRNGLGGYDVGGPAAGPTTCVDVRPGLTECRTR